MGSVTHETGNDRMIVISAGLPRSGSGWIFNLTNDLLVAAGHQNVHEVRTRYHLGGFMAAHNCNVGKPGLFKLALLALPHVLGNSFVVKTHHKPTAAVRRAMAIGLAKCTYIFRDPRDVVLSAMEEGQRMRGRGVERAFAKIHSIEDSVQEVRRWLCTWDRWMAEDRALPIRYEQLNAEPVAQSRQIVEYLGILVPVERINQIVDKYAPGNKVVGAHFIKGVSGRFRGVFTPDQIKFCNRELGDYLEKMGYE